MVSLGTKIFICAILLYTWYISIKFAVELGKMVVAISSEYWRNYMEGRNEHRS